MPGHSLIGSVATFDSSSVMWPLNPGSMKPGGRVGQQPEAAERGLALEPAGDVVGQRDDLVRRRQHELARVQDERLVALGLDQPGEVGLLVRRVDVRVAVVLEDPEEAVDAHVDRRRLDHPLVEGLEDHASGRDLGLDVAVGEQHGREASGRRSGPRPTQDSALGTGVTARMAG